MSEPKQVIVVRRDLNMSPGKLGAQVAHASVGALLSQSKMVDEDDGITVSAKVRGFRAIELTSEVDRWLLGSNVKIVVGVDSEQELLAVYEKAQNKQLLRSIIKDEARTELSKPAYTTVGIGPADPEKINEITGDLKLL